MQLNIKDYSPNAVYHLMTQTVIPRPIAWVLTDNNDNATYNLAPFSYFTAVCSDPPLLMISCVPKSNNNGEVIHKDTVNNILRTQQLTLHIANDTQIEAVQATATPLPYGDSELNLTELNIARFSDDVTPRIRECSIAMACTLYQHQSIGNNGQLLIFAEIKQLYIDDNVVLEKNNRLHIDAAAVAPLARLGLNQFATLGEVIRPQK